MYSDLQYWKKGARQILDREFVGGDHSRNGDRASCSALAGTGAGLRTRREARDLFNAFDNHADSKLVDLIYRAAGDPAGWATLCHRLGEVCDGTTSNVIHRQIPSQQSNGNVSDGWNVDPASISEYESYYGTRNIWRTFRPHLLSTESVNTSQMMCPEEVLLQSEFYKEFCGATISFIAWLPPCATTRHLSDH